MLYISNILYKIMCKPFVFIYPGQGSQKVGMGKDLYENSQVAKEVFQEVDETLKEKLSNLIFNGEEKKLKITSNTQPALMVMCMAIVKVLEKEIGKKISDYVEVVLGHSLGEYTALCSINSIDLGTTAKLLRIRGDAMQNSVEQVQTRMVAVLGCDIEEIEKEIQKKKYTDDFLCEIANDNCPGQIILSGTKKGVDLASDNLKKAGARSIVDLNVSAPFHCSLMKPASNIMKKALDGIDIRPLRTKLISNVSADYVEDPKKIKKLLVDQVYSRVKWRESIEKISSLGISNVVEIGPGKVLTGLNKRIGLEKELFNISDIKSIDLFIEKFRNEL